MAINSEYHTGCTINYRTNQRNSKNQPDVKATSYRAARSSIGLKRTKGRGQLYGLAWKRPY